MLRNNHEIFFIFSFLFVGMNNLEDPLRNKKVERGKRKSSEGGGGLMRDGHNHTLRQ